MSCELVNVEGGYESKLNRKRVELTVEELEGFRLRDHVRNTTNERVGTIYRFILTGGGVNAADIRYWTDERTSLLRGHLRQVNLFELEKLNSKDEAFFYPEKKNAK